MSAILHCITHTQHIIAKSKWQLAQSLIIAIIVMSPPINAVNLDEDIQVTGKAITEGETAIQ